MAIPIHFNTLFVRLRSIQKTYSGGLAELQNYFFGKREWFVNDDHLVAFFSMGGLDHIVAPLTKGGLIYERNGILIDMAYANQADGIESRCDWLDSRNMADGSLACWLRGESPGFLIDLKEGMFQRRVSKAQCPECSEVLGIAVALLAMDTRERTQGPLGSSWYEWIDRETQYLLVCRECGAELTFDTRGKPGIET